MELLDRLIYAATGVATWAAGKYLYRTFKGMLEGRRVLNDYSGNYPTVPPKHMGKDDYPVFEEGDHVVRSNGGVIHKGEQGTVMRDSGATEKYVLVNWKNNQTWISKNCLC